MFDLGVGAQSGSRHHSNLPTHPWRCSAPWGRPTLPQQCSSMPAKAKESAYPEPLHNSRCRLDVLGIEVGGRWSEEAASFITDFARTKIRDTPAPIALRRYRLFHFEMDSFLHTRGRGQHLQPASFSSTQTTIPLKKK